MSRSPQTKQTNEVAVKTGYLVRKKITVLTCEKCGQQRVLKSDVQAYFDEIKIGANASPEYVNETDFCTTCKGKARIKEEMAIQESLISSVNEFVVGA